MKAYKTLTIADDRVLDLADFIAGDTKEETLIAQDQDGNQVWIKVTGGTDEGFITFAIS